MDERTLLYRQRDSVLKIWRLLLENAIVYLKNKDEREKPFRDDAAYGVRKLYGFFKKFHEFEPLLYGAEKELYRDHITHMFSVFLLGNYLIRNNIKFENVIVGNPKLPIGNAISVDEKEAMWCIMSLTHDLGYALEGIPNISPQSRKMLEAFGLVGSIQEMSYSFPESPLHDILLKFISSDLLKHPTIEDNYISHTQSKYFLKFAEAMERFDHGIISCLVLLKNLVYFLETDFLIDIQKPLEAEDARQFQIRRDILRPIAGHNCDNIYYIEIPRFDFLLKIVDDMQEWGRPRFRDLFVEPPITSLKVKAFNTEEVHYLITFGSQDLSTLTEAEAKKFKRFARTFFARKSEALFMALRSAVVGLPKRHIKVTIEVLDNIGESNIHHRYKIIHKSPEDVEIYEDEKRVEWLNFDEEWLGFVEEEKDNG